MRKIEFLLGAGVGFVLGSKAGPGPYQQLESRVRSVAGRPDIRQAVLQAKSRANEQVGTFSHKLSEKLTSPGKDTPTT